MPQLAFHAATAGVAVNSIRNLELRLGLLFVMERFGDLISEAALVDDLLDQPLIAVLKVGLRFRPASCALS